MMTETVLVELGERSYPIVIGPGTVDEAGDVIAQRWQGRRSLVVTHPSLASIYGDRLRAALRQAGFQTDLISIPEGESSKSLEWAQRLYDAAIQYGFDRTSVFIALGGGVVGDLVGFAAATYMRGVGFAQVPTSLLAQVDASVGGKVAIDYGGAKNLVGAFHQPCAVVIDTDTLKTLPDRHYHAGLAEVVKYGIISDADFFSYLEQHREEIVRKDPTVLAFVIRRCCELKAAVVAADERDLGMRAILNYGHTAGHALEAAKGLDTSLLHGEAVAIGMMVAGWIAVEMGRVGHDFVERQRRLLEALGLPVSVSIDSVDPLMEWMLLDKKAVDGSLRFVLPSRMGAVDLVADVQPDTIRRALQAVSQPS